MPTTNRLLLLAALCGTSAVAPPAAPPATLPAPAPAGAPVPTPDPAATAYLGRFRADYARAVLGGAPDPVLGYYADDVRLMPAFQQTVMGRAHAAAYHRAFAGRFAVRHYTRTATETLDLGPRVVEHGAFTMRLAARGAGSAHELRGKYQDVWARRPDGRLALVSQAWSYDHDTGIDAQLRFDAVPAVHVALRPHVPVNGPISFELAALNRLAEVVIAAHDARVWAQFYADDAVLMYGRHPAYAGRAAIDRFLAAHVRGLPVFEQLAVRTDRIDDLGRYVLEYASHIAVVRFGEGSAVSTGKNTVIWRREPGGSLKIFRSMSMYD
jgi:ketosteroid isomerase-like protein